MTMHEMCSILCMEMPEPESVSRRPMSCGERNPPWPWLCVSLPPGQPAHRKGSTTLPRRSHAAQRDSRCPKAGEGERFAHPMQPNNRKRLLDVGPPPRPSASPSSWARQWAAHVPAVHSLPSPHFVPFQRCWRACSACRELKINKDGMAWLSHEPSACMHDSHLHSMRATRQATRARQSVHKATLTTAMCGRA